MTMTVDELVQLTEALTAEYGIKGIVSGDFRDELSSMDPEDVAVLVRFLGGERPDAINIRERRDAPVEGVVNALESFLPIDEEQAVLLTPVNEHRSRNVLAEKDPTTGRSILKDEFAGVELP